jgi:hypothetical protein
MRQVIEARERTADIEQSGSYGTDLLGLMMSAKNKRVGGKLQDVRMTTEEIIDECKTFYSKSYHALGGTRSGSKPVKLSSRINAPVHRINEVGDCHGNAIPRIRI